MSRFNTETRYQAETRTRWPDTDPRTIGELLHDLRDQASHLFQQEMELAKVEARRIVREVIKDSTLLVVGLIVGLLAAMALTGALAAGLTVLFALVVDLEFAVWLGPLATAVLLGCVAGALILAGRQRLKKAQLQPEQTKQSLREDAQWLKKQLQ